MIGDCHLRCSMPDNRNDKIEGSLKCEKLAEKKPLKAEGYLYPKTDRFLNPLILKK